MPKSKITPEIAGFIRDNYLKIPGTEIAEKFGIDKGIVYRFKKKEGLKTPKKLWAKWRAEKQRKPLTKKELDFIRKNIHAHSIKWMAKKMHRTNILISNAAKEMGFSDIIERNAQQSRFNPGHIPANKGKTMDADTREKVKHTWYKKGHIPHNTNAEGDGAIVIRKDKRNIPYKHIRISIGHWEYLHRHVWKLEHGPIPKGTNIVFKNGDTLDCRIENLEMISNAENMKRNTIHNYPPELKKAIRINAKINKTIKNN